jgi:Tol biopolymer transport system component
MRNLLGWRLMLVLCLSALLLLPAVSADVQKGQQAQFLLEQATKKELIDGDLKGAIETYQKILSLEGVPRPVVARALLQLGQCYEKLGSTEARKAYERLVREFADQSEETEAARARLASLGAHDGTMRIRRIWAGRLDDLWGAAPTRDGRYVTFQGSGENLAVRELATGQTRTLTSKAKGSHEFALSSVPSPDGQQVAYAWYNTEGFVDLRLVGLDGSNLRVLYASREVADLWPVDWSPDGKNVLAVFSRKDKTSQIALVAVSDGSVRILRTFDRGAPGRARFTPDGRFVAYDLSEQAGSAARDIGVFAVDGGRETVVVRHPANDVLFDWTPDGRRLLFGSDRSGAMGAWWIEIADGQPSGAPTLVKPDLGQDVRPMGFARDGSYYYEVRTRMTDVYIAGVDFASGRTLAPPTLATDRYAGTNSRPDWSADGRELVFLSQRGPGVWGARAICVRKADTGEVREIASGLKNIVGIHWYPDGRSLLAAAEGPSGGYGPFRIDVQSGAFEPLNLTSPAPIGQTDGPAWSADGKTLFYLRWGPAGTGTSLLVARDLATGRERELHSVSGPSVYQSGVKISPDSQWLAVAFRNFEGQSQSLTVVPASGGQAREVLRSAQLSWPISIAWAPDGQGLLFVKQPDAKNPMTELWLVPLQGGEPRKLDLTEEGMRDLHVHPDGRHIAFTAGGDRSEVLILENFLPPVK